MPRSSPVHSSHVISAWLGGATVLACGTEAPPPPPPPPIVSAEPPAVTPGIKFDVGTVPTPPAGTGVAVADQLRTRLTRPGAAGRRLRAFAAVQRFYARRDHRPAWTAAGQITAAGVRAIRGLDQLRTYGLDPADYDLDALAPVGPVPSDVVGFELGLTDAWLSAAADLQTPRGPRSRRRAALTEDRADQLASALDSALTEADPGRALHALAPSNSQARPSPSPPPPASR